MKSRRPGLLTLVLACLSPLIITLLFITWTQSLLLQMETEPDHVASSNRNNNNRDSIYDSSSQKGWPSASNNNNNNNNNNIVNNNINNNVDALQMREDQKRLEAQTKKHKIVHPHNSNNNNPPPAQNVERNDFNNYQQQQQQQQQQQKEEELRRQEQEQQRLKREEEERQKQQQQQQQQKQPGSSGRDSDEMRKLYERVDYRLTHKHRKHQYRGDSSEVRNQPQHCKQRKGRDYTRDPIMYITPRGTGSLERMDCPIPCTFTSDRSKWPEADGAMYVIPGDSGPAPPKVCPLQKSVLFSMESEVIYPVLALGSGYNEWDILGTTRFESDVALIYGSWAEYGFMEPLSPKTADAMAVAAISNCGAVNNRLEVLQELQDHGVTVHSYGRCKHNKDRNGPSGGWFKDKVDMLRPYKFVLAFENSNVDDYVSEKFFQAFVAGTVPVYMGAPNIQQFKPGEKSIIAVSDFPTVKALAEHLKFLNENDNEYQKYLEWKKVGPSDNFLRILNESSTHSNCRLCMRMKQIFDAELEGIPD